MIEIARVFLRSDIKNRIKNGHPWIYDGEIDRIEGDFSDGDIVDVFYHSRDFLGRGYINSRSRIRIRLLTRRYEEIDKKFFLKKIRDIVSWKKNLVKDTDAFRVVFSEADGLPGLVVDKYSNYLVIQIGTLGMEKQKSKIVDALVEEFDPKGIYEKSDYAARKREGLEKFRGWIYKSGPELIEYRSNGLKFYADTKGQKTGAFLDQRENAKLIRDFVEDEVILDVFSYTGNFAAHALRYGAKHVTLVDYSERALDVAKMVLDENGFSGKYDLVLGNAFDKLREIDRSGEKKYGVVMLDPPAFAKSTSDKRSAYRGYKEINLRAMRILPNGGTLITSSCSRVVSEQEFMVVLYDAASDTKRRIRILRKGSQPPDHAPQLNIFETFYLKFLVLRVEGMS